jgi:hypothetical protein
MKKNKLNYFDEFIKISELISKSTTTLIDLINNYNNKSINQVTLEIHKHEHECDKIVHNLRNYLISDFLPPFDRDDIIVLIYKLDSVEDGIDELAKNFKILNITEIDKKDLTEYTFLLKEASEVLNELFTCLKNMKNKKLIQEKKIKLSEIEEAADRCYEEHMEKLYTNEKDAIKIIKWTNMYNGFEETFDIYQNVADCIGDIIIKNS